MGVVVESLAQNSERALARPLKILVPLINDELEAAYKTGIDYYRHVGELLWEAKFKLKETSDVSWTTWVRGNVKIGLRQAYRYMELAQECQFRELRAEAKSGVTRAPQSVSEVTNPKNPSHRPAWYAPVQEATNALDVEKLLRQQENK